MSIGHVIVVAFIILVLPITGMATTTDFIENYTYRAGESDSKLTCRAVSIIEIKRKLLEKIGTYLESRTEVMDFRLEKDDVVAIAAGFVKLEIMDETWNGETYSMTAKIEANPEGVTMAIEEMRRNKGKLENIEKLKTINSESLEPIHEMQSKIQHLESDIIKINKDANANEGIINAWGLYEKAVELRQGGNAKEAIKLLNIVIQNNPTYLVHFERGLAYLEIGRSLNAISDMTEVLKFRPNMKGALYFRGLAYNQSGNKVYGRRDIEKSAELGGILAKKWLEKHPAQGWNR